MEPIDTTLVAIASAARPLEPVQLQKALFLLARKTPELLLDRRACYAFKPYDYGPFDSAIYSDAESLERAGLICIRRPPESRYKEFIATTSGLARAEQVRRNMAPGVSNYLRDLVFYTQSLSFNQLVEAIYREFPDMKANSVFKDRA